MLSLEAALPRLLRNEGAVDPEDVFELAEAIVEGDTEEIVEETLEILFDVDL
ncbi:hypothetical protein FOF52_03700 [Thermobifida alba]|uniref:Uncharacterized protein n=1 Tax=Thermobifida alba TaxID=53522 RepID=A0ABY4KXL3_THEAE|nr:hypothetical protein [Thermobifida alba]UPT20182.1 hypothetical protein FOF52_03700 [Thermobifida alba]HLU97474.1 hypothetical protein [Thermobifida alba]